MFLLQINLREIQQKPASPHISAAGLAKSETNIQGQAAGLTLNKRKQQQQQKPQNRVSLCSSGWPQTPKRPTCLCLPPRCWD